MARDGFRIFDSDTHVGPDARILAGYLSQAEKDRLRDWDAYKSQGRSGQVTYTKGQRRYRRRLGAAEPDQAPSGYMAGFTGVKRSREPSPLVDADPGERIKDMDHEGVDVNLTLPSGWFGTWTAGDDVILETAMYRAYHRWMADYCGAYPNRLGGVILAAARDIEGALGEIRRWGQAAWAWGIMVYAPVGMPLDHPALEPLYAKAAELDLAVVLHTFTVMPPYAPGGQDTWDNLWLQRSAAHPWCGMRNMAAMIGSGVMDRYPTLRVGTLEAGHGWLPFWMARLDEHAETIKAALPELGRKPSEYVTGGAVFPEHRDPGGRQADQRRDRSGRRSRADVRLGLSPRRKPLSRVGLARGRLGDGHGAKTEAAVGQCHPLLRTRFCLTPDYSVRYDQAGVRDFAVSTAAQRAKRISQSQAFRRGDGPMPDGMDDDLGLCGLVEDQIGIRRRRHPTNGRIVRAAADVRVEQ
jgi:uncharacterized protein